MVREIIGVFALLTCLGDAHGKSSSLNYCHEIDSTLVAVDIVPPAAPVASVAQIRRGLPFEPEVLSDRSIRRPGYMTGLIVIRVDGTDDQTKPLDLGYRFELIGGTAPQGFSLRKCALRPIREEHGENLIVLTWEDEATTEKEPFDFRVYVYAVDQAGNESEPSEILRIRDIGRRRRGESSP